MPLASFRLTLIVDLFTLSSGELQCTCRGSLGDVQLKIRPVLEQQTGQSKENNASSSTISSTSVECIATCEFQPTERIVSALKDIEAKRLPPESIDPTERPDIFAPDGSLKPARGIDLSLLPVWFQQFRHEVYHDLYECASRIIKLARWYCNADGGHRAIKSEDWFRWCWVGQPWQVMPPCFDLPGGKRVLPVDIDETTQAVVCKMMKTSGLVEPVAHELFREAWELQRSNPRSALIVGIAAAEAAIKQFIVETEPGTKWIIENTPSPPLSDLLRKYLPIILDNHNIRRPANKPPNRLVMTPLEEGIKVRNKVAHGIEIPIEQDLVTNTLNAIRDILWMLDVYRGHEWARMYLRPETLEAWDPNQS